MLIVNLTHTKGDTYKGSTYAVVKNGGPLDLTGAKITAHFRLFPNHPIKQELSTDNGGITIVHELNGLFKFSEEIIDFPAAIYVFDVEIITADGTVRTPMGGTFNEMQDVTH